MGSLDYDILSMIFVTLDHFDIVHCSSVCKSWYDCIHTSNLLKMKYCKRVHSSASSSLRTSLRISLKELAMEQHRLSLQSDSVDICQWNGHSARVDQCRMKMGLLLTGVGDKMHDPRLIRLKFHYRLPRIWSLKSYKCLEEYPIPDMVPLADFDFDESKVVGLVGTRICIWRRHGKRSIFPLHEDTVTSGLCMRYIDPEAVVGCGDGTARVFDMYSKKCSRIIRMHGGPVTCLALTDDQLILSGSSLGSIKVAGLSSDQRVASLRSTDSSGIRSLCFNPCSSLVFAGSTSGYLHCWDLRTMKQLWETRASSNVIYSVQHMHNDTSSLVTGGIDGVLRILNQNTGDLLSSYVISEDAARAASSKNRSSVVEKKPARKLPEDAHLHSIPKHLRPPITCLSVGMKKVVTTHNSKIIRLWKFNN
ncbi:hypothetical protein IFM89_017359 [Coptis chinensis]|uniref:F-box domain-containing protein n=1 Tax=Coptis chinensis TaxID=261450 RepID=A0A835H650_9MAGN|nr:hypothetical protein IFM89_017359 [Coptis chinensis]